MPTVKCLNTSSTIYSKKKIHNIKYSTVQVLQVVGDKFATVITDINGIGLHIKPVCSKITVWTTKTTLSNYKNIQTIGYIYLFINCINKNI